MSAFSEAKNYADLIECCHLVLDRCHAVDGKIAHFGMPDARRMALANLQQCVAGLLFSLQSVIKGRNPDQIQAMFGAHGVPAESAREVTQDFWRWSLTVLTHFRIDSLFQCLLRARGEYRDRSPFGNMLRQLLDVCELKDRARTESIFLVAAYSRNAFHNN